MPKKFNFLCINSAVMTYTGIEHPHNNTRNHPLRHIERTSYLTENFTLSCVILLGLLYP
jgi:hypothetical protein